MSLVERLSCGYDSATLFVALGYCVTSSLLSIINKARDALCLRTLVLTPSPVRGAPLPVPRRADGLPIPGVRGVGRHPVRAPPAPPPLAPPSRRLLLRPAAPRPPALLARAALRATARRRA